MKNKLIVLLCVIGMTLSLYGCTYASVNKENVITESMFICVEETYNWKIVYNKENKVMYCVSTGGYNCGNFTLLVNPDGSPMIYKGE